jgi:ribose/xylose/arabinose/galactoside ABC-type transport system permease subunit
MRGDLKGRLRKVLATTGPLLGLLLVYALFLVIAPPAFHSVYNTKTILTQSVIFGIGALGMTLVIISGGIDLSAGSLIALGTVVTGLVLRDLSPAAGPGAALPLLGAMAAVAVCALCAFASGAVIVGLRIVPFIVTLGMMQIARGAAKGLAGQTMVNTPRNWLEGLMIVEPSPGVWHSLAPGVWIMLGLLVFMHVVLRYTVFGRHVYAVGSNADTARLCGVRVGLTRLAVFTCYGALTGVASVMQFSTLTQGDPTAAEGMELDIIAAVVIGGGSLSGGEGSVAGSLVGALIMAVLRNGCRLVGIPNYVQNIVIGTIIIAAVGVDRLKHARQG